ncbi:hypothetical protein BHU09_11350 [Tannerella sp. oral taxon 808]|nr:hypothetical protein BHU09_11350 [Tannerella sp. oral taxon 808]
MRNIGRITLLPKDIKPMVILVLVILLSGKQISRDVLEVLDTLLLSTMSLRMGILFILQNTISLQENDTGLEP